MCAFLYPDEYLDSTYSIDFDQLYKEGYRGIIFDIDKIIVANKRFGIFLKKSPPTDNIYSMEVFIMHLKIILYCYILLNKGFIFNFYKSILFI